MDVTFSFDLLMLKNKQLITRVAFYYCIYNIPLLILSSWASFEHEHHMQATSNHVRPKCNDCENRNCWKPWTQVELRCQDEQFVLTFNALLHCATASLISRDVQQMKHAQNCLLALPLKDCILFYGPLFELTNAVTKLIFLLLPPPPPCPICCALVAAVGLRLTLLIGRRQLNSLREHN